MRRLAIVAATVVVAVWCARPRERRHQMDRPAHPQPVPLGQPERRVVPFGGRLHRGRVVLQQLQRRAHAGRALERARLGNTTDTRAVPLRQADRRLLHIGGQLHGRRVVLHLSQFRRSARAGRALERARLGDPADAPAVPLRQPDRRLLHIGDQLHGRRALRQPRSGHGDAGGALERPEVGDPAHPRPGRNPRTAAWAGSPAPGRLAAPRPAHPLARPEPSSPWPSTGTGTPGRSSPPPTRPDPRRAA